MKDLFQDVPEQERPQHLEDNCYKCEVMDIKRPFTKEELDGFKEKLSEDLIQLNELETKLDDIKDEYRAQMQPYKEAVKAVLKNLKNRYEEVEEKVYMFDDQATGEMLYYDAKGQYLQSRKLFPAERQGVIKNLNTGTNG